MQCDLKNIKIHFAKLFNSHVNNWLDRVEYYLSLNNKE